MTTNAESKSVVELHHGRFRGYERFHIEVGEAPKGGFHDSNLFFDRDLKRALNALCVGLGLEVTLRVECNEGLRTQLFGVWDAVNTIAAKVAKTNTDRPYHEVVFYSIIMALSELIVQDGTKVRSAVAESSFDTSGLGLRVRVGGAKSDLITVVPPQEFIQLVEQDSDYVNDLLGDCFKITAALNKYLKAMISIEFGMIRNSSVHSIEPGSQRTEFCSVLGEAVAKFLGIKTT